MAITQQTPYNNYTGNGSTTVFAYTFKLFLASDLKVYLDGVLQTETTHYTVSGVGTESGGNVTFVAAPASSVAVQLVRSIPYNRLVDYQTSGDLLANTLDNDLDRMEAQVQQVKLLVDNAVLSPLPGANYDAGGRRIVNLADPVDAQDVMTYASALASVTTAAASASAAQSAQSAAEIAQAAAEAAFDSFDDRYLGAKAADPTLDNDGNALVEGAIYWNTTLNNFKVWSGTAWQAWQYSIPDGDKGDITVGSGGASFTVTEPTLAALKNVTTAADKLIYATGSDTFSTATLTAFARTLLDDADAATMRTTLGALGLPDFTGTNQGLGGTGYQKLPGGLIIQWGRGFTTIEPTGKLRIYFPISFTGDIGHTSFEIVSTAGPNNAFFTPLVDGDQSGSFVVTNTDLDTSITQYRWFSIGW